MKINDLYSGKIPNSIQTNILNKYLPHNYRELNSPRADTISFTQPLIYSIVMLPVASSFHLLLHLVGIYLCLLCVRHLNIGLIVFFFFFSVVQRNAYTAANYHQPLSNHVSSLICPDKPAMKLDTSFPVSSVRVFYRQLDKNHRFGKSAQTQIHTTRRIDNQPKHFIDIYHWSVFDTA